MHPCARCCSRCTRGLRRRRKRLRRKLRPSSRHGWGDGVAGCVDHRINHGVDACTAPAPTAGKETALSKLGSSWVKIAEEGQTFQLSAPALVQYGADSGWTSKELSGTVTCDNATFGRDPLEYVVKACYVQPAPPAGTLLAQEGASFTVPAPTLVKYGADSRWITKSVTGTAACTNTFFGDDPAS